MSFYDVLAPNYQKLSEEKKLYLDAIDSLITTDIKTPKYLDVGSADGVRASKIASKINAREFLMVEPSSKMASLARERGKVVEGEIFLVKDQKFDVVTCLWNVIGHVEDKLSFLKHIRTLLDGKFFIDVQNRYNAESYGFFEVSKRFLLDSVFPDPRRGDAQYEITVNGEKIPAMGHLFTPNEIERLIKAAGFKMIKRIAVSYKTGKQSKYWFLGQLFYELE